jgi:hypothetical protein
MAVINGRLAVMDVFDQPATLAKLWDRLIVGYATDAISRANVDAAISSAFDAIALLEQTNGIECEVHPAVDLGEEWRFEGEQLVGSALVTDGVAVHLSVFPNAESGSQEDRVGAVVFVGRVGGRVMIDRSTDLCWTSFAQRSGSYRAGL